MSKDVITRTLESKIHALEELLSVSESSFLEESEKLEKANVSLQEGIRKHEKLENDIKQILDASYEAIRVVDNECNIIYANESLQALKEIEGESIIGRKCYDVVPEKECFTENCSLKVIQRTGKIINKEITIHETPYMLSMVPYRDAAGNIAGLIKTYRDITEEKHFRKVTEENALQRGRIEMANNMLHDIGNALTGISSCMLQPQLNKNWTEIDSLRQLKGFFDDKRNALVEAFGKEKSSAIVDFMDALIDSLAARNSNYIEFSRKVSDAIAHVNSVIDLQRHYMQERGKLLESIVNIKTIIQDSVTMLSSSLQKRDIVVEINTTAGNLNISGDQTRLIRVFLNVIKNIYESYDELEDDRDRYLHIQISEDQEHNILKIMFIDNAKGFSSEVGENFFRRGFTTKQNGLGIGLHECRDIIESHGGEIKLESKGENSGAMTIITFPLSDK